MSKRNADLTRKWNANITSSTHIKGIDTSTKRMKEVPLTQAKVLVYQEQPHLLRVQYLQISHPFSMYL